MLTPDVLKKVKAVWVNDVTGAGGALSATSKAVKQVDIYGYSAVSATAAPTANVSSLYVGFIVSGSVVLLKEVAAGEAVTVTVDASRKLDLADIYVGGGAAGDKAYCVYVE